MNAKTKKHLIASTVLGLAPFGSLALLIPSGEIYASAIVVGGLVGLGWAEVKGAVISLSRRAPKGAIEHYRHMKAEL